MSTAATVSADSVPNRGMITIAVMLATIMQVLDTTIANVALPNMQGNLSATQDSISWVLTSYIVAAAVMTPATGWLSGRLGRRNLFLLTTGGFTVASVLCGLATSLPEMVLFRILQGIFGAALVPLSQAVLLDINPRERHGQAMAMWGAGIMVAPIIGPTLGGWLTDAFGWRWVFYINLPVGILAFLGLMVFLPRERPSSRRFDMFGFLALGISIAALQMMLDRGEQLDWFSSREIWIEAAICVSALWVFVVHIVSAREPFLEPAMFKDLNFAIGLVFIFAIGIVLLATMALLPPMLQKIMGYPTVTSGLLMAPRGVGTMISMLVVGRLVQKVDARILIFTGLALTAYSLHQMTAFSIGMDRWPVVWSGVVQGLGLGLVFVPLSTLAFATLQPRLRTEATALFSLMRNIGSSIGISIVVSLLARNTQIVRSGLVEQVTPGRDAVEAIMPQLFAPGHEQILGMISAEITRQAAMVAYVDDYYLMMFVVIATAPLLLLMRKRQESGPAPAEAAAME
ncbi:DHA2 family efflux MFS transporter permease subunit [Microbaculum marinum]|uniref:DHA2 family efflux MFS transporter permease subunit n=1 Tax=Microbaculum marinum TaxID=1764581 RepID=A0AAW9RMN2_9HYPH